MPGGTTATFVFTDLANSTEVLTRAGDDAGRRIFNAHHVALRDAAVARGGHQVKWNHDGGFFAFPSAAEALRFAIAAQQWCAVPRSAERLELKVGLNTGEAFFDGEDYFGAAVVVASRLCDAAAPRQVLCSNVVRAMLAGASEFTLTPIPPLSLKGIAGTVDACEVQFGPMDPATAIASLPFVGRQRELERLRERFQRAARGDGGLVLVAGEPGIGKTRLVEQAASEATELGALVLTGHCYEGDWTPPYAPFGEALTACVAALGAAEVAAMAGEGLAVLARLTPALQPLAPASEPIVESRESQFRTLEAAGQVFVAVAERGPLVLIIDDLQWADAASLSMLRYLSRMARQHRVLVLCTYRDVDVGRAHPLTPVLNALRREVEYDLLQLKGLATPEVGQFIAYAATELQGAEQAFIEAMSKQTEGNPFFIREMLLHLREEGFLVWEERRWALQGISLNDLGIPEGARQVIARRLEHLGEAGHGFLRTASIFEGPFPFLVAAGAAGLAEEGALSALEQALDARLLAPVPGEGVERYDFTHALIRGTLVAELSPSRRMRLHRDAARVLESLPGTGGAGRTFELAFHCRAAGELADARATAEHCLAAGHLAFAAVALDEAALNFEAGLAAARSLPGFDPLMLAGVLRDLTRVYQMSGRGMEAAFAAIEESLALYRVSGSPVMIAEALFYRAALHQFRAQSGIAVADLEAARELLGGVTSEDARRLRARIAIQLGQAFTMQRRYGRAEEVIAEALQIAGDDAGLAAEAQMHFALSHTAALKPREAQAAFQACAEIHDLRPVTDRDAAALPALDRMAALNRSAVILASLGRFDEALEVSDEGARFFGRVGDPYRLAWAFLVRGYVATLRGQPTGREHLDQAFEQLYQGAPAVAASTAAQARLLAVALWGTGEDVEATLAVIRGSSPGPTSRAFEALAAVHAGDQSKATEPIEALSAALAPRTPDVVALPPYLAAAEFALRFRDRALAKAVTAPLAALEQQGLVFTLYWPSLLPRLNGGLAALLGDFATASEALQRALATAERCGAALEHVLVRVEMARLALLRRDRGEAHDHANTAEHLCQANGLGALRPRVQSLFDELRTAAV